MGIERDETGRVARLVISAGDDFRNWLIRAA
jgi:hypothetical protein